MDQSSSSSESTQRANPLVASLLSLLSPGLSLAYTGRLLAGLIVNVSFILLVLLFVIAVAVFEFFPLFPAAVVVAAWLLFCALSSWHATELIQNGRARRSSSYQHPLIYTLIALLTFLAPLAVTGHFTQRHLLSIHSVTDDSMAPQIRDGDWLLTDRTSFRDAPPDRGELVVVQVPDTDERIVSRIIGTPADNIRMHGYNLQINDRLVAHSPFDEQPGVIKSDDLEVWIEHNNSNAYMVSLIPGSSVDVTIPGVDLGDNQYFVLSDNRSWVADNERPVDSRHFGTITDEHIEGSPLYVAWSTNPGTALREWDRLGLQPQ